MRSGADLGQVHWGVVGLGKVFRQVGFSFRRGFGQGWVRLGYVFGSESCQVDRGWVE